MIQMVGGIAVGAAAMMLAPTLVSSLAGVAKPVTKTLIKAGLQAFDYAKLAVHKSCVAVAEASESIEDLAAEAKAEIHEAAKPPAKPAKKKAA